MFHSIIDNFRGKHGTKHVAAALCRILKRTHYYCIERSRDGGDFLSFRRINPYGFLRDRALLHTTINSRV